MTSLTALPEAITGEVEVEAYRSLAGRDLQYGHAYALPSGKSVARAMGEWPLRPDETALGSAGWSGETPLWLYVLSESEHRGDGERLGPVGGRIVAEVLIGIIDADPASYRSCEPGWTPAAAHTWRALRARGHADAARRPVCRGRRQHQAHRCSLAAPPGLAATDNGGVRFWTFVKGAYSRQELACQQTDRTCELGAIEGREVGARRRGR